MWETVFVILIAIILAILLVVLSLIILDFIITAKVRNELMKHMKFRE